MGPLGSHGCSATASATFQVPRSIDPECGVDQLVVLDAAAEGLRLHPGDDALARLEAGFALHGVDHVCIVQVAVAEIESDQRVAHELALPHRADVDVGQVRQQQREQTPALAVHASPRVVFCRVTSAHFGS